MRSLTVVGNADVWALFFEAFEVGTVGGAVLFRASFEVELDRSLLLPCPLSASASLGELARAVAELGAVGGAGGLFAFSGGPSVDKTAGARLLVADPERSVGDCPDEVLPGLGITPVAAAAAADLGKGLGGVLFLAGGSRRPSEGDIFPELDFAACPKNSLRPDCWEAGLEAWT